MSMITRVVNELRTNGLASTLRKTADRLKQMKSLGKQVIFSCDLPLVTPDGQQGSLIVEHLDSEDRARMGRVLTHWDEDSMSRAVRERFGMGARLWLAKRDSEVVG